jgi:alpha-tubulin suppressor-like RCC1 family protein
VAAGASHTLALTATGGVLAWGSNNHGQLGRSEPKYAIAPLAVDLPERAEAVAAGMYFSLALGESGHVYAWGWNSRGQLGLAGRHDRFQPTPVPGLANVAAIAAGQAHAAALTSTALVGWGSNAAGQIGAAAMEQHQPFALLAASIKGSRNA